MSFLQHLEELRIRLITCFAAIIVGVIVGLVVANQINQVLISPFIDSGMIKIAKKAPENTLRLFLQEDGSAIFEVPDRITSEIPDPRPESPASDTAESDEPVSNDTETTGALNLNTLEIYAQGETEPIAIFENGRANAALGYFRPLDPFVVYFKTALIFGIILALPIIAWQAYGFIAPGLYERERKTVVPLFVASAILFPVGGSFAFFMLKYFIYFLANYAIPEVLVFNDIKAYLNFVLTMIVVFGLLFELPVVIVLLTKIGIVTPEQLAAQRKFIFVGILIVAAAMTPGGEPLSMIVLSLPLYILFEAALIVCWIGNQKKIEEAENQEGGGV